MWERKIGWIYSRGSCFGRVVRWVKGQGKGWDGSRVEIHKNINFLRYCNVSEDEKNEFKVENFEFCALKYFPTFQDGGHKKIVIQKLNVFEGF